MPLGFVGAIVRGRAAWFCGIALGIILLVVGLAMNQVIIAIAGGVFLGLSIIFLILSYATRGLTD
jgi:hypothetical protein